MPKIMTTKCTKTNDYKCHNKMRAFTGAHCHCVFHRDTTITKLYVKNKKRFKICSIETSTVN